MINETNMTFQELNMTRRSINFFDKEKDVNMTLVKKIITESFQAPSAYNLQPWRIILVKSNEGKELLHSLAFKQPKILDSAFTLILIGDKEGYESHNSAWDAFRDRLGNEKTKKIIDGARKLYGTNESTKLKFEESHVGLLAMNLMQLFKAYRIDTHPMSGMNFNKVKESFDLKETEEVVMLLAVGYRDESKQMSTRRARKSYEEVVTEI